jgi:ATP-binding cassette subfamily F protein 3
VKLGVFAQGDEGLEPDKTVLMQLWDSFPRCSELELRSLLGKLGLRGDDVFKKVSDLSGGEKARLKLTMLILGGGNVLMLDEPTNHLDMDAKEALEEALSGFEGTLIVVSHDRYLLKKLPTRIVELCAGEAESYEGAFDSYRQAVAGRETAPPSSSAAPLREGNTFYRSKRQRAEGIAARRRQSELEAEIARLEQALGDCQRAMAEPDAASDYQRLEKLAREAQTLGDKLAERYAVWERMM